MSLLTSAATRFPWKPRLAIALLLAASLNGWSQGTFQNLGFEDATLIPIPGDPSGSVEFSAAFPGWTGYVGGQMQRSTIPNGVPIGEAHPFISIMAPPGWIAWQGSYEVGFGAGTDASGSYIPVALTQVGQVPVGAMSMQFLARFASAISVFLGGQQLSLVPLGSGPGTSRLYGADVSIYAGQTLELRFQPGLGIDYLDDIQFSSMPIPEPSTAWLGALGAGLLGWRLARRPAQSTARRTAHSPTA